MKILVNMRKYRTVLAALLTVILVYGISPIGMAAAAPETKQLIFDNAELLSQEEKNELNALANEYGAERETDIIILTADRVPDGSDPNPDESIKIMTEDFYDEYGPGYDKKHGNAVILTVVLETSRVHLEGYYKAEEYLDNSRLDKIRDRIIPALTNGDYRLAFEQYIKTAHRYMGFKPGVNPDNILFSIWFQLGAAVVIGGIAVFMMAYRSGGRVTVNHRTYEDTNTSGILAHEDRYLRTTTTKRKIERNNGGSSGGGGGGGGGVSRGGHSHSGSTGKF